MRTSSLHVCGSNLGFIQCILDIHIVETDMSSLYAIYRYNANVEIEVGQRYHVKGTFFPNQQIMPKL